MPNIGFPELMILLVIALLVFGAKRLPEIGSSMGKGIREFKRSLSDTQDALMNSTSDTPQVQAPRVLDPEAKPPSTGEPKRLSQ